MTFVTPILVSSLGGARAPVAQAGTKSTDVIWEVWEVFDHDTPIWTYLLGCYHAANGGVNDMPHAMGYVCVCMRLRYLYVSPTRFTVSLCCHSPSQ